MQKQYFNIDELNNRIRKSGFNNAYIKKTSEYNPKDLEKLDCAVVSESKYTNGRLEFIPFKSVLENVLKRPVSSYSWYGQENVLVIFEDDVERSVADEDI